MHTLEVKDAIDNYAPSKVLETLSPKISEDEKSLPRGSRRQLAQLRSGFSCLLQSYNHRIKRSDDDKCPDCRKSEHTTRHLFSCPKEWPDWHPKRFGGAQWEPSSFWASRPAKPKTIEANKNNNTYPKWNENRNWTPKKTEVIFSFLLCSATKYSSNYFYFRANWNESFSLLTKP